MSKRDEYAREVLRAGRDLGITPRGIVIAFATVSVECDWIMYANRNDPESLKFPHERVGSDANSVGLFQQRAPWWGTVADRMDPYRSAKLFFTELKKLDYNNPAKSPGWYAQAVQRSAYPDRYDKRMTEAQQLYDRIAAESGGKHRAPEPAAQEVHTVGDPIWLADVLREEGLTCDIYPGAFNRGKGDFAGIWGVMAHHTGAPAGSNPGPKAIAEHPSLGLASQLHLDRNGKYTLCGVGIAWHAGVGSYPGLPTNDANRLTIGIEAENSGTEGWQPAQYDAYVRGVAAILRKLGHDSSRVIGHKEWGGKAQGKWDPGGIDMDAFRRDVQKHIDKANTPQESNMSNEASGQLVPHPQRIRQINRPQNVNPSTQSPAEPWPYDMWADVWNETVWDGYDIRPEYADVPDNVGRSQAALLQTIAARQVRIESKLDQLLEGKQQ